MLAIASTLEGMSWADAARLVGMERKALQDAAGRHNVEGLEPEEIAAMILFLASDAARSVTG